MLAKIWHFFFPVKPFIVKWNDDKAEYEILDSKTLEVQGSWSNKDAAKNYCSMLNEFRKYNIDPNRGLFDSDEDKEYPEPSQD